MTDRTQRGAHALGDHDRRSGGWWGWLLPLLLLLAVAVALIALLSDGDDESAAKRAVTNATAPSSTSDGAAPAGGSADGGGSLTAGSADLASGSTDIAAQVGQTAVGKAVVVQSVVDSGFFVGSSATDRRYVEYGGDVGADEPAQSYKPAVGDKVDLTGPLQEAPKSAGSTLRLNEEDAALVSEQGAYINADTVKAAA